MSSNMYPCPRCGVVRQARDPLGHCASCSRDPRPGAPAPLTKRHNASKGYGPVVVDEVVASLIRESVAGLRERFAA